MLKTLLLAIVVAVVLLLVYASTRPSTFHFERSVRIKAPAERIFAFINDLHRFNEWNPYEKKDPSIKGRYGEIPSGPGATYAWESDKVGTGSMEITDITPPSRLAMKLDFIKPFEAHNTVAFTLKPDGDATFLVTWAMNGPVPFFSKVMQVFMSMDKMVGKDFEDGLNNLKALAERP